VQEAGSGGSIVEEAFEPRTMWLRVVGHPTQ
jgi:hypothetical protein